jgi:hypothetical protein
MTNNGDILPPVQQVIAAIRQAGAIVLANSFDFYAEIADAIENEITGEIMAESSGGTPRYGVSPNTEEGQLHIVIEILERRVVSPNLNAFRVHNLLSEVPGVNPQQAIGASDLRLDDYQGAILRDRAELAFELLKLLQLMRPEPGPGFTPPTRPPNGPRPILSHRDPASAPGYVEEKDHGQTLSMGGP